ncbi:MAG: LptE family protein [Gemmataceae bacterium]
MNRRRFLITGALGILAGCQGTPTFLGYKLGSKALYDTNIKTVYVPVFNNRAFQTTPYRGMEVDITRAVVREINAKTPFKVVSDCDRADTELKGVIVSITKNILNRNQQNLTREAEVVLTVDVLWRDLRTGKNLSSTQRQIPVIGVTPGLPPPEAIPFDPSVPLPPGVTPDDSQLPVRLVATGRLIPELGESITTGEQKAINLLAVQIVSMMEKPS